MKGYDKAHFERIISDLEEAQEELREVQSGIEDELDRMPGRFRCGSKGDKLEEQISMLDDFCTTLDELVDEMRDLAIDA